jgi:serine/threonine-protein kinase
MIRHATETARPLREFNSDIPDGLQQIVNWMLAKNPSQRYSTPERAAKALEVFLTAGAGPVVSPEADAQLKPYLTWLEDSASLAPSVPGGRAAPAAVAPPVIAVSESNHPKSAARPHETPTPKPMKDPRTRKQRRRHKQAAAPVAGPALPVLPPPAPQEHVVDTNVEMVPITWPPAPVGPVRSRRLSRRDFALFGIGALAGSAVTFLGCYIALKISTNRDQPPAEPTNK